VRAACGTRLALLMAGLAAAATLRAESLYVIEQLVVAVSSAPDASGERVATLKSGDRVELIERSGEQAHVRLAGGREGWVRASYLTAEEPLRTRLAQREAEVARLGDEVKRLESQLRPGILLPVPAAVAPAAAAPAAAAPPAAAAVAEDPMTQPGRALFGPGEQRPPTLRPWTIAAALIAFGSGFGLGALTLDWHIRRKYGGLRIY
jgi:Bacterial SH3 domain